MVTRLERYVYLAVAALALCAAALAAWPAVAQAQAAPAKKDTQQVAERVVVRPGDSLWTISSERLGADATPQQIAEEAERIYALNRDRIGPDPDVLFPDQELSVPAAGKPSATAPDQEEGRAAEAPAPTAVEQPANLPKAPEAAPVPNAETPASDVTPPSSLVASFLKTVRSSVETAVAATTQTFAEVRTTADGRQQLGLGIIVLTFLIGGLMAWKLPMKRSVGDSEAWEIYSDYAYAGGYGYYAYRERIPPGLHGDPVAAAPATEQDLSRVGLEAIARARRERIRRGRARRFKRLPRRGLAADAYSPEVRSSLRGSVPRTQPRTPRNGRVKIAARQINGGR